MLCMVLGVEARPVACTDWPRDLDSLARWLPQRHYDFFTVRSQADFDLQLLGNHEQLIVA